jgi:UDP-2,3-diacylglucosamine pyrophosphatase LpxH
VSYTPVVTASATHSGDRAVACRTAWISDLHLGTKGSNAEVLYQFLQDYRFGTLYIVGDLIDAWRLKRSKHWPQSHTDVLQTLLNRTRQGVVIIYIPGNHDEFVLQFLGDYGNIRICKDAVHVTADGRRLLVMHGHEFDIVTTHYVWVAHLGDIGYNVLQAVSRGLNHLRMALGYPYWSLSGYVKTRVKERVKVLSHYEQALTQFAHSRGADGIICGHIHNPLVKELGRITYYNTGDWVDHCTALIEHLEGRLELIHYGPPGTLQPEKQPALQEVGAV